MKSYIRYEECFYVHIKDMDECSMDEIFYTAANMIAFNDCSDIEVIDIVINNEEYFYVGWQPDMLFEFEDKDGNVVWRRYFPNWNH